VFWGLKALQFHFIAEASGSTATFTQHVRAYLYGDGANRLVPFGFGSVATVASLEGSGVPRARSEFAAFTSHLFYAFEIAVFAAAGLVLLGWATWIEIAAWSLAILAICWLVRRGLVPDTSRDTLQTAWRALQVLAQSPLRLAALCLLSIVAFLLLDGIAYLISNAFSGEFVIMHVETSLLLVALVAGHLAKAIQITPDGIGQFEWGFALALYIGGLGAPEAAAMATIFAFIRYFTGLAVLGGTIMFLGLGTSLGTTIDLFRGAQREVEAG
jgi:uncharacterized membrane protein YbhN (UPF0104 family)